MYSLVPLNFLDFSNKKFKFTANINYLGNKCI